MQKSGVRINNNPTKALNVILGLITVALLGMTIYATAEYTAKVSYVYDSLGQLTRENNVDLNKNIVYN